jgi:hypothetical protein
MISKIQVLITWIQYVIAAKDKKDEVIWAFKSPRYVAIGKEAAILIASQSTFYCPTMMHIIVGQ